MDCSLPSSSVHGILQARILEWVAISCSRGSSCSRGFPDPGIEPRFPALEADALTSEPPGKSGNDNGDSHYGLGFPGGSVIKNPPANAGDVGSIPGLGRCPGEGNGTPLQYSCLGNPMNRGAWRATVHGVSKESDTTGTKQHQTTVMVYWERRCSQSLVEFSRGPLVVGTLSPFHRQETRTQRSSMNWPRCRL